MHGWIKMHVLNGIIQPHFTYCHKTVRCTCITNWCNYTIGLKSLSYTHTLLLAGGSDMAKRRACQKSIWTMTLRLKKTHRKSVSHDRNGTGLGKLGVYLSTCRQKQQSDFFSMCLFRVALSSHASRHQFRIFRILMSLSHTLPLEKKKEKNPITCCMKV